MSGDLEIQDTSLNICAKRLNMEEYRCLWGAIRADGNRILIKCPPRLDSREY